MYMHGKHQLLWKETTHSSPFKKLILAIRHRSLSQEQLTPINCYLNM